MTTIFPETLPDSLRALLPHDLLGVLAYRRMARAQLIFSQGRRPSHMFYAASGEVLLQRPGMQGENVVLQRVRQGFFAEASLQSARYHCDAVMAAAGDVIAVPIVKLRQALLHDPAFAMRWISMLNGELKRLRTQCERLSLTGVKDRVLHLIETEGKDGCLTLKASLKSFAAEIGVTHEALYRTLSAMERQGQLLRLEGQLCLNQPGGKRQRL